MLIASLILPQKHIRQVAEWRTKVLRFYQACKLPSCLGTISRLLAEDPELPSLWLMSERKSWTSHSSRFPLPPSPIGVTSEGHCAHSGGWAHLKNPELRESEYLVGTKQSHLLFAPKEGMACIILDGKQAWLWLPLKILSLSPWLVPSLKRHTWINKRTSNNNKNISACEIWRNAKDLWRILFEKWYFLIFSMKKHQLEKICWFSQVHEKWTWILNEKL